MKSHSCQHGGITSLLSTTGVVSVATLFCYLSIVLHFKARVIFIKLGAFWADHKLIEVIPIQI